MIPLASFSVASAGCEAKIISRDAQMYRGEVKWFSGVAADQGGGVSEMGRMGSQHIGETHKMMGQVS